MISNTPESVAARHDALALASQAEPFVVSKARARAFLAHANDMASRRCDSPSCLIYDIGNITLSIRAASAIIHA